MTPQPNISMATPGQGFQPVLPSGCLTPFPSAHPRSSSTRTPPCFPLLQRLTRGPWKTLLWDLYQPGFKPPLQDRVDTSVTSRTAGPCPAGPRAPLPGRPEVTDSPHSP